MTGNAYIYIFAMAAVSYLIRTLPLTLKSAVLSKTESSTCPQPLSRHAPAASIAAKRPYFRMRMAVSSESIAIHPLDDERGELVQFSPRYSSLYRVFRRKARMRIG